MTPLSSDTVQSSAEVADVLLKQSLQVRPLVLGALLLQQSPLGVQDLVLLLQEAHLPWETEGVQGATEGRPVL